MKKLQIELVILLIIITTVVLLICFYEHRHAITAFWNIKKARPTQKAPFSPLEIQPIGR